MQREAREQAAALVVFGGVTMSIEYRTIERFPGYRFGSDGSVWTCWKTVGRGKGVGFRRVMAQTWVQMRPWRLRNGYLQIHLRDIDRRKRATTVHRAVLEAFAGPCPPGMECCHIDGVRSNNSIANLRWDTKSHNAADRDRHGTTARSERHSMAKLTAEIVRAIRADYDAVPVVAIRKPVGTLPALATKYGISKSAIGKIVRRETWEHV